jgi:transcriptional regulator with XRE-family HTH domain
MEAIRAHGIAAFAAAIEEARQARGWSYAELARHAFGVAENGVARNHSYLRTLLTKRHSKPHNNTVTRLARALDLDPERLLALRDGRPTPEAPTPEAPAPKMPVALPPPRGDGAVPFLLAIQPDGTAILRINLAQVSADKAFRVMAALTSAGLLPTGAEKLT